MVSGILKPLILLVPRAGVEPARYYVSRDFKSLASTNSATQAQSKKILIIFKNTCQDFNWMI